MIRKYDRLTVRIRMLFLVLVRVSLSVADCSTLPDWQFNCTLQPDDENTPYDVDCPKSGVIQVKCEPYVVCTGVKTVNVNCYPSSGKNAGTALCLSMILGWFGADRFYLGYPTIGIFKLLTGGFFGLGWYIDIFLIALRIVGPARGGVYKFEAGGNFRIRLPGRPFY